MALHPVNMPQQAQLLWQHAHDRAWLRRLMRGTRPLRSLSEITPDVHGSHYAGTQTVALDRIQGSENKSADFDATFRPLNEASEGRWRNMATAWLRGEVLPPVDLVQIGDTYFVRDGHHRISVARALGREYIDATVTVWDVD
jgi:hypothetical protein